MDTMKLAELLFPHVTATPEELEARFPERNVPEGAVITRTVSYTHLTLPTKA